MLVIHRERMISIISLIDSDRYSDSERVLHIFLYKIVMRPPFSCPANMFHSMRVFRFLNVFLTCQIYLYLITVASSEKFFLEHTCTLLRSVFCRCIIDPFFDSFTERLLRLLRLFCLCLFPIRLVIRGTSIKSWMGSGSLRHVYDLRIHMQEPSRHLCSATPYLAGIARVFATG